MLAYNGLALITEKLQNQRLEEAQTSTGGTPYQTPTANSSQTPGPQQAKLPVSPEGGSRTSQSNLAVKGKNVWALSLESERHGRLEVCPTDLKSERHGRLDFCPTDARTLPRAHEKSQGTTGAICRHRKLRHMCQACCDSGLGTPTAPPKKKHCRSLSVPPDAPVSLPAPGKDVGAKIWKPIAVIPLNSSNTNLSYDALNNNNNVVNSTNSSSSSSSSTGCGATISSSISSSNNSILLARQDSKDRDFCHPYNSNVSASAVCPAFPEASVPTSGKWLPTPEASVPTSGKWLPTPEASVSTSGKWLPRLSSSGGFVKLLSPPSSASSPSVPSPPSVDSGHFTTSDLQTPPGSPVPRPASAASSDTSSFSSLHSPWLEYSPGRAHRIRVLENRSLSLEDRISGSSASSSALSTGSLHEPGLPRYRSSSSQDCVTEGCVGGAVCGAGVIPRCHSQPCVLHHRRCGKKRRRDCDRPNLNFNKMTETAYTRSHRRSEPWNTAVSEQQVRFPGQAEFIDIMRSSNVRGAFCLNPIASSPLDCELPAVMSTQASSSSTFLSADLSQAASIALPLTPPEHASPLRDLHSSQDHWEGHEEEEEDPEPRDCNCHDSRTDDGVGLFPMNDLDLDQIEND